MESKLRNSSITTYSKSFAAKICEASFKDRNIIAGKEIMKITPVEQINLFIVMILFQAWEEEARKLKSPYFNYDHPDVKEALKKFHNVLSNHIEIDRKHFEVLLSGAVEKAIILVFSPYHFFVEQFSAEKEISKEKIKRLSKYVRINNHLMNDLITRTNQMEISSFISEELIQIFDEVCGDSQEIPEDFNPFIKQLSETLPLSLDMIYTEEVEEKVNENEAPEETQKELFHSDDKKILNDKLGSEPRETLNEKIKTRLDSTLAEIHQNKRIEDISKSLSINQRFMFTKELFNGDKDQMEEAIAKIEQSGSLEEAISLTENTIARDNKWDMESEEAIEFIMLVRRRFGA